MTPVRVVTVTGDPDTEASLATALAQRAGAELVLRCVDRVELLAAIRGASPDLIVSVGCPPWLDGQACAEARAAHVPLVGLSCRPGDAEALAAVGVLVLPATAGLDRILAIRQSDGALPDATKTLERSLDPSGRLVSVWGPKGAPGRSTVAVELAAEVACTTASTVLVDADTYGGDLAQMLGVVEELPTIVWASRAALDAGADVTAGLRRTGPDGPALIPGITRPDLWGDVGVFAWSSLTARLRTLFEHTIVDVGFCLEEAPSPLAGDGRNAVARSAVRESDRVVAVCRCDPIGLKTFLWTYPSLLEIVDEERIVVCANRVLPGDETSVSALLRRHAGKAPVAYVPDDPAPFRAARTKGVPVRDVAPGSATCRAVRELSAAIGGKPRPTGIFARLAGRT